MQQYQSIYARFGYQIEDKKVYEAFCNFIVNEFWNSFNLLIFPGECKEERTERIETISDDIFKKICRALCVNPSEYSDDYKFLENHKKKIRYLIQKTYKYNKDRNNEIYAHLQIMIDIIYPNKDIRYMLDEYIEKLNEYLLDFPSLGIKIQKYKTKSSQIFPIISKVVDEKINRSINILEDKKFNNTIAHFEDGLKQFLKANDLLSLKNVLEDMRGSCDEVIKEILNNKKKGMKSIFSEPQYTMFGLTPRSKKIFEEFMGWMDDLKHGSEDITKQNIIMIIGMTADFIQFIINNSKEK